MKTSCGTSRPSSPASFLPLKSTVMISRALHETQTRLLGPARFDENFVLARHPRADVAAGLFCEVKFAEDPARLGNQLAQLCIDLP